MAGSQRRGLLRVFISSTFRDLQALRRKLIDRIEVALEAAAMEKFVPRGETSQTVALAELCSSDVVLFLFSSCYGSDLPQCDYADKCRSECGMKTARERISYTWCEYRVAKAEGILHKTYIVEDDEVRIPAAVDQSSDTCHKARLEELKKEVEQEFHGRIRPDDEGAKTILEHVVENILDWYSSGRIGFGGFSGRLRVLRDLLETRSGSIEVTGVGGIGKTALCEVALLLHQLSGRAIVYVGEEEAHASGTGYEFGGSRLKPRRVSNPTIDDVIDALGLGKDLKKRSEQTKNETVAEYLDATGSILFLDGIRSGSPLEALVKLGNRLRKGCIILSTKKESGVAAKRVLVRGVEETSRVSLVRNFVDRLGKQDALSDAEVRRIAEVCEGHPIAAYVLTSNAGRVDLQQLTGFKNGLDFSRDADVQEYLNRVIRNSMSPHSFELLTNIAVIEEAIDFASLRETVRARYQDPAEILVGELVDLHILDRRQGLLSWRYNQVREAILDDAPKHHQFAADYFRHKLSRDSSRENEISLMYHLTKGGSPVSALPRFVELAEQLESEDISLQRLQNVGEEILRHVTGEELARVSAALGTTYQKLAEHRNRVANSQLAIQSYQRALAFYKTTQYPIEHARTKLHLGIAYRLLAEVSQTSDNCEMSIRTLEELLSIWTPDKSPREFAVVQANIATAHTVLAGIEHKSANCHRAILLCNQALEVFPDDSTEEYAAIQQILGETYRVLAETEDKVGNSKQSIEALSKSIRFYKFDKYPAKYALIQNGLGIAYGTLAQAENKAENSKRAIKALQETLRVYTLERFPFDYARTKQNLGTACRTLAEAETSAAWLKSSINCYNEALRVFTRADYPALHAAVCAGLGDSYAQLSKLADWVDCHMKAIEAYRETLNIYSLRYQPAEYERIQWNLGMMYGKLAGKLDPESNYALSVSAFLESLKVLTIEGNPDKYAKAQIGLGASYFNLARYRDLAMNCQSAIQAFKNALGVLTIEYSRIGCADMHNRIGLAYELLASVEDKVANCRKAIESFETALEIPTDAFPDARKDVSQNLRRVREGSQQG